MKQSTINLQPSTNVVAASEVVREACGAASDAFAAGNFVRVEELLDLVGAVNKANAATCRMRSAECGVRNKRWKGRRGLK